MRFVYASIWALCLSLFVFCTPSLAGPCTAAQKAQAQQVQAMLREDFSREPAGASVVYVMKNGWYALNFDSQLGLMRTIADTEYCLSDGRISIFSIEYAGDTVARATPTGGIQVVKSRP